MHIIERLKNAPPNVLLQRDAANVIESMRQFDLHDMAVRRAYERLRKALNEPVGLPAKSVQ